MNAEGTSSSAARSPEPLVSLRLSAMMFLQWAMFGLWIPLAGVFLKDGLGFDQGQRGWILGISGSIGALCAPFIAGQVADRWFSTERLLAVLLIAGACLWWTMTYQTVFPAWLALSVISSVVFAPTGALTNSLAFAHLTERTRQFPLVRVWGTIGWIVAGWVFPMVWLQTDLRWRWMPPFLVGQTRPDVVPRMIDSLRAAAVLAVGFAVFCLLLLPHTPPNREARQKLAFAKAFGLFRRPSFLVLMVAGILIAAVHNIYFMEVGNLLKHRGLDPAYIAPAMTIGQFVEIVMIAVLGLMLKGLGFRWVLAIGGLGYLLRFAFFGSTVLPLPVVVASLGLHGVCFACFYAAAFIYIDRLAEDDIRHSVQTVFGILLGAGPVIGGWLNGFLARLCTPAGGELDLAAFWYTVAAIGGLAAVVLAVFFRDETAKALATKD